MVAHTVGVVIIVDLREGDMPPTSQKYLFGPLHIYKKNELVHPALKN